LYFGINGKEVSGFDGNESKKGYSGGFENRY
jgi:hypothetical protein